MVLMVMVCADGGGSGLCGGGGGACGVWGWCVCGGGGGSV